MAELKADSAVLVQRPANLLPGFDDHFHAFAVRFDHAVRLHAQKQRGIYSIVGIAAGGIGSAIFRHHAIVAFNESNAVQLTNFAIKNRSRVVVLVVFFPFVRIADG